MNIPEELKIFAGTANQAFTARVCEHVGISVGDAKVVAFPDSEVLVKLEEDVRGRDCFVVQSTSQPVNENLMELLIWID